MLPIPSRIMRMIKIVFMNNLLEQEIKDDFNKMFGQEEQEKKETNEKEA